MRNPEFLKCLIAVMLAASPLVAPVKAQSLSVSNVWYPVTITFEGPNADETAATFRNNRMNVTFTKGSKSNVVPGYFAADGNAAETSATSGNKWRVKFTPDEAGLWHYSVSFRTGTDIAAGTNAGSAGILDGVNGAFTIASANPGAPGFYSQGMLKYVGQHFLQFAGSGAWFVKGGPGSPEDFFGYEDFDGTFDAGGSQDDTSLGLDGLHAYAAHTNDWQAGDPTWQGGKGKGIIGAINYLSSIGMNTLYNVLLTHNGDAYTTWPWTTNTVKDVYDVSKLDQWDIVFTHMDAKGINSDLYLGESENTKYLNNGDLGVERIVYYRELMARFGYHLGWRWCIGEEPQALSTAQVKAIATHLQRLDPYGRAIGAHCSGMKVNRDPFYTPLLGYPDYNSSFSQINEDYHLEVLKWIRESAATGTKWVVPLDEPNYIAPTDAARVREGFWKVVTAGGEGFDLYVAYNDLAYSDVTVEDFTLMSVGLAPLRHGVQFFQMREVNPHLPNMVTMDSLMAPAANTYCFAEPDVIYVIYSKTPAGMTLDLSSAGGTFKVRWFDPRNGGVLQPGTVTDVTGGAARSLGNPPNSTTSDWVALVFKPGQLTVNAGPDQSVSFPQSTNQLAINLAGSISAAGNVPTSAWWLISGPGTAAFANSNATVTTATITGNAGVYVFQLAASDGVTDVSDTMTVTVSPYAPDTTPPVVMITAPVNGASFILGSGIDVTASVTDNVAVQKVELLVDGTVHSADSTPPYSWTVGGLGLGKHTLAVRGMDISGNTATNSFSVNITPVPLPSGGEIARDSFETYPAGSISGRDGGSGWAGAWSGSSAVVNGSANPISFTPLGGLPVPSGTNVIEVVSGTSLITRQLGSALPDVFYVGYVLRLNAGSGFGANNTFSLHLADTAGNTSGSINFGIRSGTAGQFMVRSGTATPVANAHTGGGVPVGTNLFLVARFSKRGAAGEASGTYDRAELWLNPTADDNQTSPNGDARVQLPTGAGLSVIRHVLFRQAALDADDRVWFDHPVVGTNWSDIVPVLPADTTPPTVGFVTPANGQVFYLGQAVPVSVSATDNVGVLEVSLFLNDLAHFLEIDDTPPYAFTVPGLSVGVHQLLAVVNDDASNQTTVTNQIVVLNLPSLQTGQPTNGLVPISWNAPGFMLQTSPTVIGFWSDVAPSPASPFFVNPSGAAGLYRLRYSNP